MKIYLNNMNKTLNVLKIEQIYNKMKYVLFKKKIKCYNNITKNYVKKIKNNVN